MIPLSHTDLIDLSNATLRAQGRFKMSQIAQPLQKYVVMRDMLKKDKVAFETGDGISRNVMVDMGGSSRQVGMFAKDILNIGDHTKKITMDWKHTAESFGWERKELLMNAGSENKILDLMKIRRTAAYLRLAKHWEEQFFQLAAPEDTVAINGLPYWVVKSNAAAGFNGGLPSGYSTHPGNLNHPNFKNFTFTYSAVTKDDALFQMRNAMRNINFESPVDVEDYRRGSGQRFRIFTNWTVQDACEKLLEDQNDDLGTDLWKYDGAPTFRRIKIEGLPILNADTTDPIYMVDLAQFYPVFLKGDYIAETPAEPVPGAHNTIAVQIDATVNWICNDRRAQAVGYKV